MIFAIVAAWGMIQQPQAPETHFTVPPGFVVDRPSDFSGSLISLTFAPDGSAYIGREAEGIVRLSDVDHDGRYERVEEFAPELTMCQGLAVKDGALLSTGVIESKVGLWRVPISANGLRAGPAERLFEFTDGGEHGAHAVVVGPDGSVYVIVGNQSAFSDAEGHASGYWAGDEGRLLPPYMDPLGFGAKVRYPAGFVARVDLEKRTWQYVAVGIRNAYDLAFDNNGYMFAVDSDMEWDIGLPWYRPVRLLEILEGADYGSRAGSSVIPEWCVDTEPALLDLGRGSPTGAVFGTRTRFPLEWKWALYSGDWARGKILALSTGADIHSDKSGSVDFLSADTALPITDIEVGPEGGLWFLTGGRGAHGGVFRVQCPAAADAQLSSLKRPDRESRGMRTRTVEWVKLLLTGRYQRVIDQDPWFGFWQDRSLWPLQARIVWWGFSDGDRKSMLRSRKPVDRASALVTLASVTKIEYRADAIAKLAPRALDDIVAAAESRTDLTLAGLRGLELGLLRQGDPSPELMEQLATRLLAMFPNEDARIAGEVGVLLSHLDDVRALAPLMSEMAKSPQELAIHYADCVHRMTHGWDAAKRRAMLDWFARSSEYTGGISLPGYLSAMRAHFIANLQLDACKELAPQDGIEAESLALILARLPAEDAEKYFAKFETALARIVPKSFGTREQSTKDAALRALSPLKLAAVDELARKLAVTEGGILEAPWALLARSPDPRDYALWVGAIVSPSSTKRETAFGALEKIELAPTSADEWRALLDHAREIGSRRGRELTRTLARWCRNSGGAVSEGELSTPKDFDAALAAIESWYAAQFPQGKGPSTPDPSPHWSEEQILAFLKRAKSRPGSPALGRVVFEAAGCIACHAVGTTPATDRRGFGPDLANVTDRLSDADLLAAIMAPSRIVSDQYRAFIALTKDDRMFEGIVTRRDDKGIEIRPAGQEPIEIESDDLESLKPSTRSSMPEGLLDSRTLEEVRDLFAYLKNPAATGATQNWSALFGPGGIKGWDGDAAIWSLRGATLFGRSVGIARSSYILAPMPAQDMCVEFDVFLPPGGNSGLCYRAERPSDPATTDPSGAQADLGQSYWGTLYTPELATHGKPDAALLEAALDRNGWNHVLVRFAGDQQSMEINGFETYSLREALPPGTKFGFQVHQGKPMQVRIANARWRAP